MRKTNLHAGVNLVDSEVTDAGLQYLPKDVNTLKLKLEGSKITDTGLQHIPQDVKTLVLQPRAN